MKLWCPIIAVLLTVLPVLAQEKIPSPRALPEGGVSLLPKDALVRYQLEKTYFESGTSSVVDAPGTPYGKVVRLELRTTPKEWWHAQIKWPTDQALSKGQAVLLRVLIRVTEGQRETNAGKSELGMQQTHSPWGRLVSPAAPPLPVGSWRWIDLPMISKADYAAGTVQLVMNFGYFPQVLEVADVQATAFGKQVSISDLPQPDYFTYEGREENASWRISANERIEKYRKGNMTIRVVNASGHAVPDAQVSIRMKKHAFLFGTCTNENLLRQDADGEKYRQVIKDNFNVVVDEGAMKWAGMVWHGRPTGDSRPKTFEEQQQHISRITQMLSWFEANGIKVRGHTLIAAVWGGQWFALPPYLKPMVDAGDKDGVRREIEKRIRETMTLFKGRVIEWDVVNESLTASVLQDFLGRKEQVKWYQLAKECDPNALAVINDFHMLSGGAIPSRTDAYYNEIKFLLDHGAPIDAIGEQAHFNWDLPGMDQTWKILERFAGFGKPMRITEFDVAITDEKLQADYTRDFYTVAFSHPQMQQILMWGFWEGSHWMPTAAMFRKDWTPKPNYQAYRDLVFGKWWTYADIKTDVNGTATVRGFLGDYEITATVDGRKITQMITLGREGQNVIVKVGP